MKHSNDAMGQMLMAYYKGQNNVEIVERSDGYITVSTMGSKTYFSTYKEWLPHERQATRLVRGRVLDIGCAAGRHSLYLEKKGYDVTGIDNSPLAIRVSKLRGLKKARLMSITDVVQFDQGSFDSVLMMGNNFGLLGSYTKARRILKILSKITTANARIIADGVDPYDTKSPVHLAYHKRNKKRGRMGGQLRLRIRFDQFVGEWFDYLFVSRKEMKNILQGTGWRIKKFTKITKPSYRYLVVIEKS
jgi:SAM-dependent methyltransferase